MGGMKTMPALTLFATGFAACQSLHIVAHRRARRRLHPTALSIRDLSGALRDNDRGRSLYWPEQTVNAEMTRRIEAV